MGFRILLFILAFFGLIGLALVVMGIVDYADSRTASVAPAYVELADLEKDPSVTNNHVCIGPHEACYYAGVYDYTKKKYSLPKAEGSITVDAYYYPIVSTSNPAMQKIRELEKTYGSVRNIPESETRELPAQFAVVVKTKRFKKVREIPSASYVTEKQVQGLFVTWSGGLGSEERNLLKESFPNMNFKNVLVLEEGKAPSSAASCIARVGVGAAVLLLCLGIAGFMLLRRRRQCALDGRSLFDSIL